MAASSSQTRPRRISISKSIPIVFIIVAYFFISCSAQLTAGDDRAANQLSESKTSGSLRTKLIHNNEAEKGDDWLVNDNKEMAKAGGLFDALFTSFSMILVSEIGDETFIIAALLAMRHPRSIILSGALSALVIMTILSTGLGRIVPNLISRKHTNNAATVLYTFFGMRLLYIAWRAGSKSSQQKEFEEVEEKLEGAPQGKNMWRRLLSRIFTPIFLEAFILTFLAEWGDRSQIATIALATHKNALGVTVGAIVGHTICTSVAVVGGRLLALKISQRTVAAVGGFLFLGFAMMSYFYPPL